MSAPASVSEALFVIDGTEPAADAAATAKRVLGNDVHWSVLSVVSDHPRNTSGATGFAGPVLSPDEMDTMATVEIIAGDAAAASTAGGFGDQPVTQCVARGELVAAVERYVDQRPTDLVVVDSVATATSLMKGTTTAVLVVQPENTND